MMRKTKWMEEADEWREIAGKASSKEDADFAMGEADKCEREAYDARESSHEVGKSMTTEEKKVEMFLDLLFEQATVLDGDYTIGEKQTAAQITGAAYNAAYELALGICPEAAYRHAARFGAGK